MSMFHWSILRHSTVFSTTKLPIFHRLKTFRHQSFFPSISASALPFARSIRKRIEISIDLIAIISPLQHVQILAAFALAVVQAHLVQYLPGEIQAERRLTTVQLRQYPPLATLPFQLLVTILPKPDLLEHAYQKLVHIVLDTAGRLDEFALPRCRQLLTLLKQNQRWFPHWFTVHILFISRNFCLPIFENSSRHLSYWISYCSKSLGRKKNFSLTSKGKRNPGTHWI